MSGEYPPTFHHEGSALKLAATTCETYGGPGVAEKTFSPTNPFFKHVPKISKSDYWLRRVCLSVRKHRELASTGRIFVKFDIRMFFENLSRKFKRL